MRKGEKMGFECPFCGTENFHISVESNDPTFYRLILGCDRCDTTWGYFDSRDAIQACLDSNGYDDMIIATSEEHSARLNYLRSQNKTDNLRERNLSRFHHFITVFEEVTCENCIFSTIEKDGSLLCRWSNQFLVRSLNDFCSKGQWIYRNLVATPPLSPELHGYAYLYQHTPDRATLNDIKSKKIKK